VGSAAGTVSAAPRGRNPGAREYRGDEGPQGQATVLDLACGCGSITARLLARLPRLDIVGLDRDPVLLRIARELFDASPRVMIVAADLYKDDWVAALGGRHFDAVVTATSLHWLPAPTLQRLYRDLSTLRRPGGVFANLDWMPIAHAPQLEAMASGYVRSHEEDVAGSGTDAPTWTEWWRAVANEPMLSAELLQRQQLVGTPAEFMPAGEWHVQALLAAAFSEAAEVWRSFSSAVVVAVR
jgi:SAM-dependent methyltransferase